jgi:hypothetical protein
MARNRKRTNCLLFRALARRVSPERAEALGLKLGAARWVATTEDERHFLDRGKLAARAFCLPGKEVFVMTVDAQTLVVLPGSHSGPFQFCGFLNEVVAHAGLATVLWGEGLMGPRCTEDIGDELAESVFGREGEFRIAEISSYFEPFTAIEVDGAAFPASSSRTPERVFGLALCHSPDALALPFLSDTLVEFRALLEDVRFETTSPAVFRAITSTHWEHAFLEMYRCLERLYALPYAKALAASAGYVDGTGKMVDFAVRDLGWRPREDEALVKLLSMVARPETLSEITSALDGNGGGTNAERAGRAIYSARNAIAHFRPVLAAATPTRWDAVLHRMCTVVRELLLTLAGDL